MSVGLQIQVEHAGLSRGIAKAPQTFKKYIEPEIQRSTAEMGRDARSNAPKAFSTLTNAIKSVFPSPFEGRVVAGVNYARYVEEGTDGGGGPSDATLLEWIKVAGIFPRDPAMTQEDLVYPISKHILAHGTKAQPFAQPSFDQNKANAERRLNKAIEQAMGEVLG